MHACTVCTTADDNLRGTCLLSCNNAWIYILNMHTCLHACTAWLIIIIIDSIIKSGCGPLPRNAHRCDGALQVLPETRSGWQREGHWKRIVATIEGPQAPSGGGSPCIHQSENLISMSKHACYNDKVTTRAVDHRAFIRVR